MKKYLLLLAILGQAVLGLAQMKNNQEPYLTKKLDGTSIKEVEVSTSGGSIGVTGTASDARVEVYVQPNNNNNRTVSKEEIQKRLDEFYSLTIEVKNNKLVATAKRKGRPDDNESLSIGFRVYVPGNVSTDLSTSGGSIHLDGLTGTQNFTTSGGSLHMNNLTGTIKGATSGGSIHAIKCKNDINLQTSGGSIEARDCEGKISLQTSGGSLQLENLKGTVKATTSGGSIHGDDISGELATSTSGGSIHLSGLACSLETSTSSGSIHVDFVKLGKYVKIDNGNGNVEVSLPSGAGLNLNLRARKIQTGTLHNFNGNTDERSVKGQLNGGGIPVDVDAGEGRISLSWK